LPIGKLGFLLEVSKMNPKSEIEKRERVVTFLNRDEVDFLDKLGKDALFSSGIKLSRAKLIAWLVDMVKELNITGENIKSEKDLENRIMGIMGRNLGGAR
jgi:hypothetical protein